jgi:hypothetical protein
MKKKLMLCVTVCTICALLASVVGSSTVAASTQTYTVTANAGTSTGSIMYGGIGALYGLLTDGNPAYSDISGLVHPQYFANMAPGGTQHTTGDAFVVTPEAKATGVKAIDIYLQDYYPTWPYTNPGITSYVDNVVKPEATKVMNSGNASLYRFVIFNEPDWIWYGTSGSKLTSLENDWKTAYTALRSVDSSAQILGPNFSVYNSSAYSSFFSFCKSNNCLPNVVTWHDLSGPSIDTELSNFKSIESGLGISLPVDVNEYGRTGDMGRPGRLVQYLAKFENDKVYGEMSAWGGNFNYLVGTDNQPAGCWQLYRWYGQTNGNTISVSDSDSTGCNSVMAFHNGGNNVKVIFGGSLNDTDVYNASVVITGLTGSSQSYTVYGCDYTTVGANAYTVSSGTATISGGKATISVSGLKSLSAYMVQMGS